MLSTLRTAVQVATYGSRAYPRLMLTIETKLNTLQKPCTCPERKFDKCGIVSFAHLGSTREPNPMTVKESFGFSNPEKGGFRVFGSDEDCVIFTFGRGQPIYHLLPAAAPRSQSSLCSGHVTPGFILSAADSERHTGTLAPCQARPGPAGGAGGAPTAGRASQHFHWHPGRASGTPPGPAATTTVTTRRH
jgi:hypothetical protein